MEGETGQLRDNKDTVGTKKTICKENSCKMKLGNRSKMVEMMAVEDIQLQKLLRESSILWRSNKRYSVAV